MTTACVIIETEKLGHQFIGTVKLLKDLKLHKCGHEKNPIPASECLITMCKGSHYIIATQDRDLQEKLRRKVGIPLMYLHNAAPTLEPPSSESQRVANKRTKGALTISKTELEKLKYFKAKEGIVEEGPKRERKPKKKGGPNPLSCKKKAKANVDKAVTESNQKTKSGKVEKKRKRVKIPKHVKELLKSEVKPQQPASC